MESVLGLLGMILIYIVGGILVYKAARFIGTILLDLYKRVFGNHDADKI